MEINLETASPLDFDTYVASLFAKRTALYNKRGSAADSLHYAAKDKKVYIGRSRQGQWKMTDNYALVAVRGALQSEEFKPWEVKGVTETVEAYLDAGNAITTLNENIQETNLVFANRGGWQRFFLVVGGHIHASLECSSLRWNTKIGWLPNLSGHDEASAVAEHGAWLCTICFPSAPVEWTNAADVAAKKDAECPGSKTWSYDRSTARLGFYSGNYAHCSNCGQRVTVTSTGKMRSHKPTA